MRTEQTKRYVPHLFSFLIIFDVPFYLLSDPFQSAISGIQNYSDSVGSVSI